MNQFDEAEPVDPTEPSPDEAEVVKFAEDMREFVVTIKVSVLSHYHDTDEHGNLRFLVKTPEGRVHIRTMFNKDAWSSLGEMIVPDAERAVKGSRRIN